VLQSIYYQGANKVSKLRIGGLDLSKTYRIGFNASYKWSGPYNISQYTIGSRTVYLNPLFNTSKVVYINDVIPNSNGEIVITITNPTRGSIISALTIESYTGNMGEPILSPMNRIQRNRTEVRETEITTRSNGDLEIGQVYPNPFDQSLNIDFNNPTQNGNVNVEIFDLTGRVVYRKNFGSLGAGRNTLRMTTVNSNMSPGIYMLRLHVDGRLSKTIKLVKSSK
jgi:large repetitive protein